MPARAQYDFVATPSEGCTPFRVKFHFTSSATVDTITSFYWDFGNGITSTLKDPDTVVYSTSGSYTPALVFNNRADLMVVKPDYVVVHRTVPATFTYADTVDYDTFVFNLADQPDTGVTYTFDWDFAGLGSGTDPSEIFVFPEEDTFKITLNLSDEFGCSSTSSQNIIVIREISVQNVFTPNGDNINDYFVILSNTSLPLRLRIFTRAGILVYEAEGTDLTWDGISASGQKMSPGIYFYTLELISKDPVNRYSKSGFLYMYK